MIVFQTHPLLRRLYKRYNPDKLIFWIFWPFRFFYYNLQFFWRNTNLPFLRSIEFTTNVDLQILAVKMNFHAILLPHFGKDAFKLPTSRLLIVSLRWIKSVKCVNFKCIQNFLNQISLRESILRQIHLRQIFLRQHF